MWGTNFVVIKVALAHLPPLLFAALRFTLAFLPAALFLKRPAVLWSHLATYGLLIGAGQFGILYIAMEHSISPGLASLVIQVQVFFTIGLAMCIHERARAVVSVARAGAGRRGSWRSSSSTGGGERHALLGIGLTLLAAAM